METTIEETGTKPVASSTNLKYFPVGSNTGGVSSTASTGLLGSGKVKVRFKKYLYFNS